MSNNRPFLILIFLIVGTLSALTARAADTPAGNIDSHLVARWTFDESAGTTVADASGKKHNGLLEGGIAFDKHSVPGRLGKAIQFDGKAQMIRIPDFKGITGTQPRTVCTWIKTATPGGEIIAWGLDDAGKMFNFSFIRGRVGLTPKGGYLYMKLGVNDDAWHHVAVVVQEASPPNLHDNVKLYRDGELAEIDDIGLLDLWPIDTGDKLDVRIGRRLKGALDDLRIYDRALSDEEIKAVYKQAQ